jgi:excisionase family DNA binding protein
MINDTLTADEVAKILRVSKQTLYVLCRENKFPHFKVGNKLRFKKADIEAICNTANTVQEK